MTADEALKKIKVAIETSPRNGYIAELHVQVIKYANVLEGVTGKEFCAAVGLTPAFGTEFAKMRKIAGRLIDAGLDVDRI
ncbi:HTH-like domain-containing protein [Mesorhizobium huakuii]|uniref:Transcription factor n=1 Tax=Mesorhizobium huakuii TaxID=28104 RepID=A0A7G6T087_9HYPH|nr:transcription factor [Mesorhizobium huakuii]QND60169.1 transcription factor [Mesorhizobium huakuii]